MKKRILAVMCIISAGTIAGCGGNGSSTNPVSKTSISGKVADGYLVNATVFLDKNLNYRLDAGEPSAVTDSNGAYSLTIDPVDAGKYPIVAIATKDVTIDKDTNFPVSNTYVLSMHAIAVTPTTDGIAGTVSNFISPMSSQLREMMETGTYSTIQDAMSDLRIKLGLPAGTSMTGDYIATHNTAMHTAARNMAALMGSQMSMVFRSYSSTTGVDVNRYRGMMGTIFSNLSSVRGTGANSQTVMTKLMGTMMTNLQTIPLGLPYRSMSTDFQNKIIGWQGSSMMGGAGGGMMQ